MSQLAADLLAGEAALYRQQLWQASVSRDSSAQVLGTLRHTAPELHSTAATAAPTWAVKTAPSRATNYLLARAILRDCVHDYLIQCWGDA